MVELKCKMCGGNLKIDNRHRYATCEYCGSTINLLTSNNNQMELEEILMNARKAVDDKNWAYIEKYYSLLQEKSPDNVIIETTFFRTVAKVMSNESLNNYQKKEELFKSLNVIEKYYNVTENKEEVLQMINEFLFKMAFPTGKIAYNRYDSSRYNSNNTLAYMQSTSVYNELFYNVMALFNYRLEQLSKIYNEEYIRSIISKNKQIILIVNSERRKASKPAAIFAFVSFLLMAIIATGIYFYLASMDVVDDVPVFIVIVLPWLCTIVSGIILKRANNNGEFNIYSKD